MAESAIFDIEKYEIYDGGLLRHPTDALKSLDIRLEPIGSASKTSMYAKVDCMTDSEHAIC